MTQVQRATWRGDAGTANDCAANPLVAISYSLMLGANGNDCPTWDEVVGATQFHRLYEYCKLVRVKRAFAVGGLQLVIDCGLKNEWYRDDANRADAMKLILDRGVRPLLNNIADKDSPDSIFGKNELRKWFKHFPDVKREDSDRPSEIATARATRREFPLRLRKAIEFIYLTEAVLAHRFKQNETRNRFADVTGFQPTGPQDAVRVWDYMWIEPLLYRVSPPARATDASRIVDKQHSTANTFSETTEQHVNVLHSALLGVPVRFDTALGTARACDDFYKPNGADTFVTSIEPGDFDGGNEVLSNHSAISTGSSYVENIVQLTPFRA